MTTTKTDAQVQHDVLAELKWEPSVEDGWSTAGVRTVTDLMTVNG